MTHSARLHTDTYECGELQGVRFVRVGCAHRLPRSAVEHCTALDAAFSVSAEPPHPSSVSLHETAQVGGSAESRERFSGSEEARL